MRIVALIASYNEERFISACLEHLFRNGVEAYLIDNYSSDRTVEIAEGYLGRGLLGIERQNTDGFFRLDAQLNRKEELAQKITADWFMHVDPDEIRLPPAGVGTLAAGLEAVDREGYNAVNFFEFTFVPTREAPNHDHPRFQQTMRHYYPFLPRFPHRLNAWKRQRERVDLVSSGGHRVKFAGLRMYPKSFRMRHYICLSTRHAVEKYWSRRYEPEDLRRGWHGARARLSAPGIALNPELVPLPSQQELRFYVSDELLDPADPLTRHAWLEEWASRTEAEGGQPRGQRSRSGHREGGLQSS